VINLANIKIKNLNKIRGSITKRLNRIIQSTELLNQIGVFTTNKIKGTAKTGKSLKNGSKFKKLASSTIKNRENLAKYNATSNVYSNKRSNLSFTGQLLYSIKYKINTRNSRVIIRPTGDRKPYKNKSGGSTKGKTITNKQLGEIHDQGMGSVPARPFLDIDNETQNQINILFKKFLRRKLKRG